MKSEEIAVLANGKSIPYIYRPDPPRGGMKHTYFAPDRTYVVQFFNNPQIAEDEALQARLTAIIGKYNPTKCEEEGGAKGNTKELAAYFARRFCWPMEIVKSPAFGIVCPAYPSNFFFDAKASQVLNLTGKDKKSSWFTSKNRKYLEKAERGDLKRLLQMSMLLARSIRRMHQAGLAHSDLSHNNVLIDPKNGDCVVIDIDSLVVPGIFPPEVIGTRGYMAPEIMQSMTLPYGHPDRRQPSALTDLHSLPVLLYEYLFCRHPFIGPKIYSKRSAEEDDFLALGPKALFIEHPDDVSNRPNALTGTIQDLGPELEKLFLRAFVEGLHNPEERPTAMEWERGIAKTLEQLHKCPNPHCEQGFFVLYNHKKPVCPYCGTVLHNEDIFQLHLKKRVQGRQGHYLPFQNIDLCGNAPIYPWHVFDNVFRDEKTDGKRLALLIKQNGNYFLQNEGLPSLRNIEGKRVLIGERMQLPPGSCFLFGQEEHSLLAKVYFEHLK